MYVDGIPVYCSGMVIGYGGIYSGIFFAWCGFSFSCRVDTSSVVQMDMIATIDSGMKASVMLKNVIDTLKPFFKDSVTISDPNVEMLTADVINILAVLTKYKTAQLEYSTSNKTLDKISELHSKLMQVKGLDDEMTFLVLLLKTVIDSGYTSASVTNHMVHIPKRLKSQNLVDFTDAEIAKDKNILRRSFSHMLDILARFEVFEQNKINASEVVADFKKNKGPLMRSIKMLNERSKKEDIAENSAKSMPNAEQAAAAAENKFSEAKPSSEQAADAKNAVKETTEPEPSTAHDDMKSAETTTDTDGECDESFEDAPVKSSSDDNSDAANERQTWITVDPSTPLKIPPPSYH